VLVGGGTELAVLKQMARDKKIDDYVTFTGRVSDAVLMKVTWGVCVIVVIGGLGIGI
jgi:glycosyltransferase involved in cell wall biosynthesis